MASTTDNLRVASDMMSQLLHVVRSATSKCVTVQKRRSSANRMHLAASIPPLLSCVASALVCTRLTLWQAIVIPSLFSAIAVVFILAHIATAASAQFYRRMVQGAKGERIFVTTPLGIYIVSLLFSSLLSAVGASINIEWVKVKGIETCASRAPPLTLC